MQKSHNNNNQNNLLQNSSVTGQKQTKQPRNKPKDFSKKKSKQQKTIQKLFKSQKQHLEQIDVQRNKNNKKIKLEKEQQKQKKSIIKRQQKINQIKQQKQQNQHQQTPSQNQQQQQLQISQNGDIDFNKINPQQNQQQKIDVTFLIAQIRSQYYHSMKTLLNRYSKIVGVNESQLAGEIVDSGLCGNVAVAEDDSDVEEGQSDDDDEQEDENDQLNVYSVLTILPGDNKIVKRVKKMGILWLQNHKLKMRQWLTYKQILQKPTCTLLINHRLPNLPSFVIPNSHSVFCDDLLQLKKSSLSKFSITVGQYIFNISQVQIQNNSLQLDKIIFSKFEDYQFCKNAVKWWVGESLPNLRKRADLRRLYFIIKSDEYLKATKRLQEYLEQEE